jgi:hypothetical protein
MLKRFNLESKSFFEKIANVTYLIFAYFNDYLVITKYYLTKFKNCFNLWRAINKRNRLDIVRNKERNH